jgi:hypothetical protein
MVRLVFRPYTQIRRSICTSESLRASTRVSSGFTLFRHSSPSFGSQHACSTADPSQKVWSGRRCSPRQGSQQRFHFHFALGFSTQTLAGMLDSLVRVSRRVGSSHYASIRDTFNVSSKMPRPLRACRVPQSQPSHATRGYNTSEDATFLVPLSDGQN